LRTALQAVHRTFSARGLKSLDYNVTDEATLAGEIVATASEPERRSVRWADIFEATDSAQLLFAIQPRNETQAALSVNGRRVGEVALSQGGRHAEENLLAAQWTNALQLARESVDAQQPTTVAVAINRAPCHLTCSPLLTRTLTEVDPGLRSQVRFVLAPTGVYEPTEALTQEEVDRQRQEIEVIAARLGRPVTAVLRQQLALVRFTEDTTTFNDLRRLSGAGWDIAQLPARPTPTAAGIVLAEAAHKVAVEAGRVQVGSPTP
jgi:hypothetical protein